MTGRPTLYRRWLSPEGYLGAHLAVGFVLALAAGWAFTELADEAFEESELAADSWADDALRARRHPTITAVMKAISFVGKPPTLAAMSVAVAAWLLHARSHRRLVAFGATMVGGSVLNIFLKALFHRERPDVVALSTAEGFSFPSGHSMGSMLFFGSLAYVVYFTLERRRRFRLAAVGLCGLAVLAIGVSRVYLGVHYLSDVAAGYSAALCWMGVCLSGTEAWVRWRDWRRRLSRHGSGGRGHAGRTVATVLVAGLAHAVPAGAATGVPPPCLACVVWQATPEDADRGLAGPEPLAGLRVLIDEATAEQSADAAADRRRRLAAAGARVGARRALERFGAATGPLAFAVVVVGEVPSDPAILEERAFRLKTVLVDARARHPGATLGIEAAGSLAGLWDRGLSAYVDFVVSEDGALPAGLARWRPPTQPVESLLALIEATAVEADAVVLPWPADDGLPVRAARLQAVLPAGLAALPEVVVACTPAGADRPDADACASQAYLHPQTLEAVAIVRPNVPVEGALVRPAAARAVLHPLLGPPVAHALSARASAGGARIALPGLASPFLLRIEGWSGSAGRFTAGLEVRDERLLSVEEVIARHQAVAARQRRLVPRLIASGRMVLTFQVPGLAAPMTVTADTTLLSDEGTVDIEQRNIRLNGLEVVAAGSDGVPRLPIVEPERVSRPPLAIALGDAYRYRLEGREDVRGHDCYVVAFEPQAEGVSLFSGRAWIDRRTFAMVRSSAVQTGLRGSIVSSQQQDEFVPVSVGEETAWLPARSEVTQVYEGPGHHTPIDRVFTFDRHEPNPPDFAARRTAAHASRSVILRETPEGFRYLRRARDGEAAGARVVAAKATRLRTLAAGVLVDPNISVPLPFAGLSWVDFDFLGTGTQLNAFLAVGFLQAAFSAPSLGGSRWQLHGQALAVMAEYNDRAFRGGLERYEESVRQRPARLGLALVRPLTPRLRLRAGYELSYTRLRRGKLTAPAFLVPPSPLVHGLRVSLEHQQGPWAAAAWWNPARRQRWAAWGLPGNPESREAAGDFQRYGATVARSFVLGPRTVGRLEAAGMAGRDLDRFSRYTFDAFENRLRGYPTASIRFDRGLVLRSVLTWSPAGGRVRIDGFFDTAWARDPGLGSGLRRFSGLGAGLEFPLPARALASVEWGYGFEGRRRDGGKGTNVVRVTAYKLF